MSIKDQIRAEIERQKEYSRKMSDKVNSNRMKYYFDGADEVCNQLLSFIDSQSDEQHDEDLETEIATWISAHIKGNADKEMKIVMRWGEDIARHFAEWGARHSITWGDVQLLDTFILEVAREEDKKGIDSGDSEEFYTEVLRRFHEFNDKKIPEIVAKWEAEHLKK